MPGEFKENIYYRRKSNPGDTTIEGRASNGITLDNTGNIFLYSSHDQNIINELTASNYTGSIDISPNDDRSFIGILSTSSDSLISRSPINIQMGATNYTTLNTQANPNNYILPTSGTSGISGTSGTSGTFGTSGELLPSVEITAPKSERKKLIDETLKDRDDLIIATLELPDEEEGIVLEDQNPYNIPNFSPVAAPPKPTPTSTSVSIIGKFVLTSNQQKEVQDILSKFKIVYKPGIKAGAGCSRSGRIPMSKEENVYYMASLLKYQNIPVNEYTLAFMFAWRNIEGACALYNGFNSTARKGCTKDSNGKCIDLNGYGVRDYIDFNYGIEANAGLWRNQAYVVIPKELKIANSYADLYKLLNENSNGPKNGAFYLWSQGYYDARVKQCKKNSSASGCPPPTDVKDIYIKPTLSGFEKNKQIIIINPIYKAT